MAFMVMRLRLIKNRKQAPTEIITKSISIKKWMRLIKIPFYLQTLQVTPTHKLMSLTTLNNKLMGIGAIKQIKSILP